MPKIEGFDTQPVEIEQLSERELKFGYWFITHKEVMKKAGIAALLGLSVIFYGYSIFKLGWFFIFEYSEYQNALATATVDYVNIAGLHQNNAIQPLQVVSRAVLPAGDGRVDLVARIRNPNGKWGLRDASFQFSHGGELYPSQKTFFLPGEEKYVMLLNAEGPPSGSPQVFFEDEQWRRVTRYAEWGPERLAFRVEDTGFVSGRQGEISDRVSVSEARARFTNASPYNYAAVEIQFALLSGNRLVGVSSTVLQNVASGESRDVATRWPLNLSGVTSVEVIPTVNILDQSVYQDLRGEFDPSNIDVELR